MEDGRIRSTLARAIQRATTVAAGLGKKGAYVVRYALVFVGARMGGTTLERADQLLEEAWYRRFRSAI